MTDINTLSYRKAKTISPDDIYADRDHEGQGEHFMRHLDRMTVEGLHSKSAIAGELAHRDAEIAALKSEVARPESTEVGLLRSVHAAEIARLKAEAIRDEAKAATVRLNLHNLDLRHAGMQAMCNSQQAEIAALKIARDAWIAEAKIDLVVIQGLRAEIVALKSDLQDYMDAANAEAQEVNRLNTEIAALRKDADRYRRIETDAEPVQQDASVPGHYHWRVMGGKLPSAPTFAKAVDAAIAQAVQPSTTTKENTNE